MERKCSCGNFFDVRECNGICPECKKDIFELITKPMSKQQTAIEWLEEKIKSNLNNPMSIKFQEMFEQAKQLERQQIIDAYENDNTSYYPKSERSIKAEQHYNNKYGK